MSKFGLSCRSFHNHCALWSVVSGMAFLLVGCQQGRNEAEVGTETEGKITGASATEPVSDTTTSGGNNAETGILDLPNDSGEPPVCLDGTCNLIDLLFVIDNSQTMGDEQINLAANLPRLVDKLQSLKDMDGNPIKPNVNIMVTTTDMGHPLCTAHEKPDYDPQQGAPVYTGCNSRIERFTGLAIEEPIMVPEACTASCPVDIAPGGPFIHFEADKTNVPNDDVAAALSCIGPQGIDGCGYEAPLESMLQALNPDACWNNPDQEHCANDPEWSGVKAGFLRDDAVLGVVIISDEADCSVVPPSGFSYFTDDEQYWNVNPEVLIPQATSAICWKAGVECEDTNDDGIYESCLTSTNEDVLHPVDRYKTYLKWLREAKDKEVMMLGILGVPPVTMHNEEIPFEPTEGGVDALVYRDWVDAEYNGVEGEGDILPTEWAEGIRAENKQFEFGNIGPGCTGQVMSGEFTGQAIPPVRVREVCEDLNFTDENGKEQVRCCIESICDEDFSAAIDCLAGIIQSAIAPTG